MMPRRSVRWVWVGRLVFGVLVAALVAYFAMVGLEKADKLASCVGVVVALSALVGPYFLPAAGGAPKAKPDLVEDSGKAGATDGGRAISGADIADDDGPVQVIRSGEAIADGPGSTAVTGIVRRPRP